MPIGLDWGTATVIACRNVPNPDDPSKKSPKYRQQRNCYVEMDANDFTRNIIKQSQMSFVELGDDPKVYVIGSDAIQLASTLSMSDNRVEIRRPMRAGVMSGDPNATRIMQAIAKSVLKDPEEPGEVCVYSVPADPIDAEFKTFYHRGMTEMALRQLDWDPRPINEALAIIYSEAPKMEDEETGEDVPYTGVGVSCGGGMINVCVAYRGVEALSFSLANAYGMDEGCAGDWLDAQIFKAKKKEFGSLGRVTLYKEKYANFVVDPMQHAASVAQDANMHRGDVAFHYEALMSLEIFYRKLIDYVIINLTREFADKNPTVNGALPFVISGGTSSPEGFEKLFAEQLARQSSLPFQVAGVTKATSPLRTVARGCMGASEIGWGS